MSKLPSSAIKDQSVAVVQLTATNPTIREELMIESRKIKVFWNDPEKSGSKRYSINDLKDGEIANKFSSFTELYVTKDARRLVCAAATESGLDFRSDPEFVAMLAEDKTIVTDRFVRVPSPREFYSDSVANGRVTSRTNEPKDRTR